MIEMEFPEGAAVDGRDSHGQEVLQDVIVVLQDADYSVVVVVGAYLAVGIVECVLALQAAELAVRPAQCYGLSAEKASRHSVFHLILRAHPVTVLPQRCQSLP